MARYVVHFTVGLENLLLFNHRLISNPILWFQEYVYNRLQFRLSSGYLFFSFLNSNIIIFFFLFAPVWFSMFLMYFSFSSYGWYFTFVQGFVYLALIYLQGFTTKQMVNPWKTYVKLSAVLMGSHGLTKGSLAFLNYPAQLMFKSTKVTLGLFSFLETLHITREQKDKILINFYIFIEISMEYRGRKKCCDDNFSNCLDKEDFGWMSKEVIICFKFISNGIWKKFNLVKSNLSNDVTKGKIGIGKQQ